jgi:hypothetical protein
MVDISTSMALVKEGRANPLAKVNSHAPLDRLVYEEGDLSKLPVVPHALAVRRLLHADSRLLHGRVPANATEKDFIRNGESLRPRDLVQEALRVKPLRQTPRVTTNFGNESSIAADALEAELRAVRMQMSRQTGGTRAGRSCGADGGEDGTRGPGGILTEEDVQALAAGGPSPHPTHVLESEGIRAGISSAGTIAKMLAQRPDAPIAASPAPAHHFASGGSRSQLKKEMRRAANREKLREANLELRKDQLVARNLELLQGIAAEEDAARDTADALLRAVAGNPQPMPSHATLPMPAATQPLAAHAAPMPDPPAPRAASAQPAFLDSAAAKVGAALVGALVVLVAAAAVVGARKKRRAGRK